MFQFNIEGKINGVLARSVNMDFETALKTGYDVASIGSAMKAAAKKNVADVAEEYRAKLTTASPAKLAAYTIKAQIARDPDAANQAELDLLSREAKARGTNLNGLIGQIIAKESAFRQIAMLIEVLEAEAGAAIVAIADDADDIENQILTVLGAAKAQAETAFNEALALIKGGF